jgi:thymidylate kinase
VRMEGFDGVGKTAIATRLAEKIRAAVHIRGDDFVAKPEKATPYPSCIRRPELDRVVGDAIAPSAGPKECDFRTHRMIRAPKR